MAKKTKEQISFNMKQVKNKDSDIELMLRKELWSRGLRYRKNVTGIIGKPDIVFKAKKVAIFCDSEFWHGYDWENRKGDFKSNKDFWIQKIGRNIERDKEVNNALVSEGWIVLRFWGKEIKKNCKACADLIQEVLDTNDKYINRNFWPCKEYVAGQTDSGKIWDEVKAYGENATDLEVLWDDEFFPLGMTPETWTEYVD